MRVHVHEANVQDRLGARLVLAKLPANPRLKVIRTDRGYHSRPLRLWCRQHLGAKLEVTPKKPEDKSFVSANGRWVVERSFAWLGRYRRLSKDYEQLPPVSEAMIYLASIHLLLRRLARC